MHDVDSIVILSIGLGHALSRVGQRLSDVRREGRILLEERDVGGE